MEIQSKDSERGPIIAAVLALIILGIGSLLMTWQGIQRQRSFVDQHMIQAGRLAIRALEANMLRATRGFRSSPRITTLFHPLVQDIFNDMAASKEVLVVGMYDPEGRLLVTSTDKERELDVALPPQALTSLQTTGQWNGLVKYGNKLVLISGLRAIPTISRVWKGDRRTFGPLPPPPPLYLVVGLNADKYLAQFKQYRRGALFQAGYVFSAAILLWTLAFAYLRRRDQGLRLVRLEQFQSKLLDNMPDGLVSIGLDGEILAANGSALRLLHVEDQQQGLVGRNWSEFPLSGLKGTSTWKQCEYQGRLLEILSLPFRNEPGDDPEEEQRLILIRDRTHIRSLEEDLNEARRLATIGSLAAGVAHEVRNPLSSLRGFAQFFADKFKGQKPFGSYASTMVQEADRLNRVVTDLLFLAKPRELNPEETDLEEIAESLKRLLRFDLDHKSIEPKIELEMQTAYADPDALKQTLLNLIVNSLDAVDADEGEVVINSRPTEGGVRISVRDNGSGMSQETKEQALEPFFTDKKQGTGLGLAIVQTIMRAHKGRIFIDSEPGKGTEVTLFFPNKPEESQQEEE